MADLGQRIEAMYQRDRLWAWALVVVLWITVLTVIHRTRTSAQAQSLSRWYMASMR